MKERRKDLHGVLVATMVLAVFASNLAATKIWSFLGVPVDGGLIVFPLTYVVGDLIVELFGRKEADKVSIEAAVLNFVFTLLMMAVVVLPVHETFDGQEAFSSIFTMSLRITLASLTAFVLSRVTNNYSFVRIKRRQWRKTNPKGEFDETANVSRFQVRELGSSFFGRVVDNLVFETGAFLGTMPLATFGEKMFWSLIEGYVVEIVLALTVSKVLLNICRKYLNE